MKLNIHDAVVIVLNNCCIIYKQIPLDTLGEFGLVRVTHNQVLSSSDPSSDAIGMCQ